MIEIIPDHKHKPKQLIVNTMEQKPQQLKIPSPKSPGLKDAPYQETPAIEPLTKPKQHAKKAAPVILSSDLAVSIKSTEPSLSNGVQQLVDLSKALRSGLTMTLIRVRIEGMQEIYKKKRLIEDRIYTAETKQAQAYLKFIYQAEMDMKLQVRLGLEDMLKERVESIKKEVEQGNVQVQKKVKCDPTQEQIRKGDLNNVLKIREDELKKKISELRNNMDEGSLYLSPRPVFDQSQSSELDHDYYSRDHPRTKEAEQFIRKMRQERLEIQRRREQAKRRRSEMKQHEIEVSEKSRQEHKSERHHKLVERFELKKQLKEKEDEANSRKQEKFKQFMKEYNTHKPLFRKKEEQFIENVLEPEFEQYRLRLEQIKQEHRPIDIEQIRKHEKRYMDFLNDNRQRKVEQVRTEKEHRNQRQYFKGQYRYQVLEEMTREKEVEDPKMIERMKKIRQLLYADEVKSKFVPRIDPQKKAQMQEITRKMNHSMEARTIEVPLNDEGTLKLRAAGPSTSAEDHTPQRDGLRNLKYLHSMISSLKKDGKVKRKPQPELKTLQPRPNYLKQLRAKKQASQGSLKAINQQPEKITDIDRQDRMRMRAQVIDQQARRRQQLIRLNSNPINESGQLENDYLQSINYKLALLNSNELHIG